MNQVAQLQDWLRNSPLHGIIVPSTDEFLSEFAPPANRRLNWLTGFRGSTGLAVVLREAAALFLDGRYFLQGKGEVDLTAMSVEPATLTSRRTWLAGTVRPGQRLALDPWLHSSADLAYWRSLAQELGVELTMLDSNPIDELWSPARPAEHRPRIVEYPLAHAGEPFETKCSALAEHLHNNHWHALLIADPEDVSWLLNVRAADETMRTAVGDWHVVPSCPSRAIVYADGMLTWFIERESLDAEVRAAKARSVNIAPPAALTEALREAARHGRIATDLRRMPAALELALGQVDAWRADDSVARRRWRKCSAEVESARRIHIVDAAAVVRFIAWLKRTVGEREVSEFEAAAHLESLRAEQPGYKGASMPLMSASGASGAQPHYVPRSHGSRAVNDHPIFWMDSGGQYAGGSTDNTVTIAVSPPEPKHVQAHTLVLKGFLALTCARFPVGTYALQLDTLARHALWQQGMDFMHATGHGVGNCLNIHEGPLIGREPGPISTVPLEEGMIVSNEPGFYAPEDFGLRIESHMVVKPAAQPGFLEFDTISCLPIDPVLVDFASLTFPERKWLAEYHRSIYRALEPLLDPQSTAWLASVVSAFTQAAD